jgi:hypothetical protein
MSRLAPRSFRRPVSYCLCRSLPDEELPGIADLGKLRDPKILPEHVERMIADPKSKRFVNDFVGQWLWLHRINATAPDDGLYPDFNDLLSTALPQKPNCSWPIRFLATAQ